MAEKLKFVVWNVEWMNDLFDADGKFRPGTHVPQHGGSGSTVKLRRQHLSGVINMLKPDFLLMVEAPNRKEELQLFFDSDVDGDWLCDVQPSVGATQLVGIALRTDTGKFKSTAPLKMFEAEMNAAFKPFQLDTENDSVIEQYHFERIPLYAEIKTAAGKSFRILGLHLKSKMVADAFEWSKWWERADANRRKILAQASQVRTMFLDKYLAATSTQDVPLLICGDINDGPGMDSSERKLLGSGIEKLMGTVWQPELCLGNALFDSLSESNRAELDFSDIYTTSFRDMIFNNVTHREWIDHILYTRNAGNWVRDAVVHHKHPDGTWLHSKFKYASDHLPVSADLFFDN